MVFIVTLLVLYRILSIARPSVARGNVAVGHVGTRGQGDMVTWGCEGSDAVAPLLTNLKDMMFELYIE